MTDYELRSDDGEENFKNSGEYSTYDAPDVAGGPVVKGFNFLTKVAETVGRFITLSIDPEGDDLTFDKATTRTAKYSGPGVRSIYITHDEMVENLGAEETEEGIDFPESIGVSVAASDSSAFEEAGDEEEAAAGLLADAGDDDAVEVEEEEVSSEEEEAEGLLAEAEDAA